MIDFQRSGWPPSAADCKRLANYARYDQLRESRHAEAFEEKSAKLPPHLASKTYLIADYPSLISKVSADMLFGERPIFHAASPDEQAAMDEILRANNLWTTLHEAEQSNSSRGDAVLRVRLAEDHGRRHVVIEELPASCYFIETDPDNSRRVLSHCLAWVRLGPDERTEYLRVEHHLPGQIVNELYLLSDTVIPMRLAGTDEPMRLAAKRVRDRVDLADLYGSAAPPDVMETGVPYSLLFHVPAARNGNRVFGESDYTPGLESLFDAYNGRLTKIDDILDRHAEPIFLGPEGILDEQGNLRREDMSVLEIPRGGDGAAVRYVTWEGQLQAAFMQLEKISDLIFKFSEISPAIFGEDKAGSIESGIAMRFRFARTESKISRKRNYWDPVLSHMVYVAMLLAARWIPGHPVPTRPPVITWRDGLPQNTKEQAEIEEIRLRSGTTSRQSAIMRIDETTQEAAREEIARIEAEADLASATSAGAAAPLVRVAARQAGPEPAETIR